MRDRDDNDTLDTVRKLKQGTRLSWGFASVADLIDYKLVQNSRPAFIPREFRIHDLPLSHGARRIASAQPCFSADKLNRPFYLGPCYILTDPRGFSCFLFSFFPAHFIRTVTLRSLIWVARILSLSFLLPFLLVVVADKFPAINSQGLITPNSIFYRHRGRVHSRSRSILVAFQQIQTPIHTCDVITQFERTPW